MTTWPKIAGSRKKGKGTMIPKNKFEVLKSRIMQCRVEEKVIRRIEVVEVKYFKCGEKGHKYKEYLLWVRKEKVACVARPQKVQQKERPVFPVREEAQERKLRKVEEEEVAACVAKPQEAQQKWKRSLVEELRRRAEEHCGKEVPEEACLLELGWCIEEVIVTYMQCERCREKRYYMEENRRQGVIKNKQRWCRC